MQSEKLKWVKPRLSRMDAANLFDRQWDRERLIRVRDLIVQALELVEDAPEALERLQSALERLDTYLDANLATEKRRIG